MTSPQQTVALAAIGDLGKYACEELQASKRDFFVISRRDLPWANDRGIKVIRSDYSEESVLEILNTTKATAFISFNNSADESFVTIHRNYLHACQRSVACKRFISSEYAGNIEDFPLFPRIYHLTRVPFREDLEKSSGVEWTLLNNGWFMDYFLKAHNTYMRPIPHEYPVDPNGWSVRITGTGDEPQSWTACRDVGRAIVRLLDAPAWEKHTYIAGQWGTFNEAVRTIETFYGKSLPRTFKSLDQVQQELHQQETPENSASILIAGIEEWMTMGATAVPREITSKQREKYFHDIKFLTIEELLQRAQQAPGVYP